MTSQEHKLPFDIFNQSSNKIKSSLFFRQLCPFMDTPPFTSTSIQQAFFISTAAISLNTLHQLYIKNIKLHTSQQQHINLHESKNLLTRQQNKQRICSKSSKNDRKITGKGNAKPQNRANGSSAPIP